MLILCHNQLHWKMEEIFPMFEAKGVFCVVCFTGFIFVLSVEDFYYICLFFFFPFFFISLPSSPTSLVTLKERIEFWLFVLIGSIFFVHLKIILWTSYTMPCSTCPLAICVRLTKTPNKMFKSHKPEPNY